MTQRCGRRDVFRATWAFALAAVPWRATEARATVDGFSFFVAGVRFGQDLFHVETNEQISLRWTEFAGSPACEILGRAGRRLGYVPKANLGALSLIREPKAWLERVELHAVPWKRYRVRISAVEAVLVDVKKDGTRR